MASILILSKHGDGVPLALRLADEGHICKIWIKEAKAKPSLDGYKNPSKVSDPRKMLDQYDLIICDMTEIGSLCDQLAEKGKLVLGGGSFNDKLELDREYGEKVAKTLTKLKIPDTQTFNDLDKLIDYLEKATKPQVVKPFGNKPPSLTLVSQDPTNRTIIDIVKKHGKEILPCITQEFIKGIEVSTEGWFNGKTWVRPFNHTMEKKRFMDGDVGPQVGCMGNIVWPTNGDRLTADGLELLTPLLTKVNFIGPIDINCLVTPEEAYFIEFTPRFGYEAIQAWCELIQMPLFDYLYAIASGQREEVPFHDEFAIGIRMSVNPYPVKEGVDVWESIQVLDVPKEAKKHVWLADVKLVDGIPVMAGVDGVVGCVTARGSSVRECQRRAYRTIRNITITDDVQYRKDIGDDVEEQKKVLKGWGWIQ